MLMDIAPNTTGVVPADASALYATFGKQVQTLVSGRINNTIAVVSQNTVVMLVSENAQKYA